MLKLLNRTWIVYEHISPYVKNLCRYNIPKSKGKMAKWWRLYSL